MDRALEESTATAQTHAKTLITATHSLEFDICQARHIVAKVRNDPVYAQNLYAALCNHEWQEQHVFQVLGDRTWSCSWRYAGGLIADIRGEGDYLDWYCSGSGRSHPDDDLASGPTDTKGYVGESVITDQIRADLAGIGWRPVDQNQDL